MSTHLRKARGAAALTDIIERLKGLGAEVSGSEEERPDGLEAPFARTSLRFGRARAPRRPAPPAGEAVEPLLDIDFDGRRVIVTTEAEGPAATADLDEACLKIRSARAPERRIALPCRVRADSLQVTILNGVLEATMAAEESAAETETAP